MLTNDFAASPENLPPQAVLFGRSEAMRAVRSKIAKIAGTNIPVLIGGESGTGKDVIARFIHCASPWQAGPFVKVNCPAIPVTLLESELFGYERGAFTGAYTCKRGWVEVATGGTLFLDEIAELDVALQAKLLHLLQSGHFFRIGGQEEKQARTRILCATNRRLEEEIEAGRFRRDLLYRINVISVQLPPLRHRLCDLRQFVTYFLALYNRKYNRQVAPFSPALTRLLKAHAWPGNIRELENLVRNYVVLNSEDAIRNELLDRRRNGSQPGLRFDESRSLKQITGEVIQRFERDVILEALRANNWNCRRAARSLKIGYRTLFYKMREVGLPPKKPSRGSRSMV